MKTIKIFFLTLALISSYATPTNALANSDVIFNDGQKDWVVGFQIPEGQSAITEFVPKGESVDNWSELVTQETIQPLAVTPRVYADTVIKIIKEKAHANNLHYRLHSANSRSAAFEWWIPDGPNAQHELYKVIKYPNQTIVLRYTTKRPDNFIKTRSQWEKFIFKWDPKL